MIFKKFQGTEQINIATTLKSSLKRLIKTLPKIFSDFNSAVCDCTVSNSLPMNSMYSLFLLIMEIPYAFYVRSFGLTQECV